MGLASGMDDKHLRAFGRIAVGFGEMDFLIHYCITMTLGDVETAEMISDELMLFARRLKFISVVFKKKFANDPTRQKQFALLKTAIKTVQDKRKDILHAAWYVEPSNAALVAQIAAKTEGPGPRLTYSVADLNQIAGEVEKVNEEFMSFVVDMV